MVKLQRHQIAMMPVVIRVGSVTNIPTEEIRYVSFTEHAWEFQNNALRDSL